MVEDSLRTYGAGRSILVDKKGGVIAGNKTLQSASDIDLPIRVVETDGRELVVVQRTDLDLNDPKTRELAVMDNRAGQVGLEWSPEILAQLKDEGIELSGMFTEGELGHLLAEAGKPTSLQDATGFEDMNKAVAIQTRPVLIVTQAGTLEKALRATGKTNRAEALMILCESYLHEKGQFNTFSESEVAALVA